MLTSEKEAESPLSDRSFDEELSKWRLATGRATIETLRAEAVAASAAAQRAEALRIPVEGAGEEADRGAVSLLETAADWGDGFDAWGDTAATPDPSLSPDFAEQGRGGEEATGEEATGEEGGGTTPPLCIGHLDPVETVEIDPEGTASAENDPSDGASADGISVRESSTIKDLGGRAPSRSAARTRPFTRIYQRATVPADFRRLVLRRHPALAVGPAYVRLFGALLSPRRQAAARDGRPAVVVGGSLLAACLGREVDYRNGDLTGAESTGAFLDRFNADVFGGRLEIEDRDRDDASKRARCVPLDSVRALVHPDVLLAWEALGTASEARERVYFDSGAPYTAKTASRERKRSEAILDGVEMREAHCPLAGRVAAYMNGLPARTFSGLDFDAARAVAGSLDNPNAAAQQLDLLRRIEDQPKPYYGFSRFSPRVWGMGASITGLKSTVRQALMPDAVDMDLTSAHFAIAARDWGLPQLYDFLSSGASLWPPLLAHLGLPSDPAAGFKGVVKPGGYGIVYGAGAARIVRDVRAEHAALTGSQMRADDAARLLTHPLMREALEGRERELAVIRERLETAGHVRDCFGVPVSEGASGYGPASRLDYSRSVLGQLNQARELSLMEPLLALAEAEAERDRPAWRIVLWQHDGVSVHFARDRERHQRAILSAVNENARRLGYPTRLEIG